MSAVDANKTELTRKITNAAQVWLSERGFRPVESEVTVERGWLADLAGFCLPTRTEAQKLKLLAKRPSTSDTEVRIAPGWRHSSAMRAAYEEWNAAYAAIPWPLTALVEVKASIGDFKRDRKFKREAPTHLMYLAYPFGLIEPTAVDERWGLLAFDGSDCVKLRRPAALQAVDIAKTLQVIVDVALRRDAFTSYERMREFDRQAREQNNERVNVERIGAICGMVLKIIDGEYTVDQAIGRYLVGKSKLPRWVMERLRALAPASAEIPAPRMEPRGR